MKIKNIFTIALGIVANVGISHALTLQEAQTMLLSKNLDVIIANSEVLQKAADLAEAKSRLYPSFDGTAFYSKQNKENTMVTPATPISPAMEQDAGIKSRSDLCFEVTYSVTGALIASKNIKAKNSAIKTKKIQNEALMNQLSFELGNLYLSWQLSYKQLELKKIILSQFETTAEQISFMLSGGMSSQAKVQEVQAGLENARAQLFAEANRTDSLKMELMNFIQCTDTSITPEDFNLGFDSGMAEIKAISLDENRPELQAMDLSVQQLGYVKNTIKAQLYPNLLVNAAYHFGKPELQMSNDPDYMGYGIVAVQCKFNIFDGWKNRSQQKQTAEQIETIKHQKNKAITNYNNMLQLAKIKLLSIRAQKLAVQKSLEASKMLMENAKNSYEAGTMTNVDLLNAKISEATAALTINQVEVLEKMTLLKLYFLSGKKLMY